MSDFKLIITKSAAKDITKLDDVVKKRLGKKLQFFMDQIDPLASAAHLSSTRLASWRWRIGNYRVLFDVDGEKIIILSVRHRREVYKNKV